VFFNSTFVCDIGCFSKWLLRLVGSTGQSEADRQCSLVGENSGHPSSVSSNLWFASYSSGTDGTEGDLQQKAGGGINATAWDYGQNDSSVPADCPIKGKPRAGTQSASGTLPDPGSESAVGYGLHVYTDTIGMVVSRCGSGSFFSKSDWLGHGFPYDQ
jgi:hypothetical protein